MAFEPINLFSHRIDPRGVAELLRATGYKMEQSGPDDDWQQIVIAFPKKGLFSKTRLLTFSHTADYYDGPKWPLQVSGMQNYFSQFPENSAKPDVLRLIRTFRFSLAVRQDDLDINSTDERLEMVFAVCRHLDGAIFTPSSLRDAKGRILIDATGAADPRAVLPFIPESDANSTTSNEEGDEEEVEISPPTADRVARRTLALTAVAARGSLELDGPQMTDADVHRQRILHWIEDANVGSELEPDEWKALQRPVGTLDQRAFIDSMWRVEGLVVLAWALKLHPLPPYDTLVTPPELYQSIGLFDGQRASRLLAEPDLRSSAELDTLQRQLLAFHWRMRDFSLRPQPMDFVAFSKKCWFGSFDISPFRIIDNDLAIGETAISRTSPDEISRVNSIAAERHLAINWLLGYSPVYSETDTST
ncbi:DUF4272 domain-containing protein [Aeoliella sp. SH292]|uniref:DUF4272 domain-containing protein n=1 Tax=Aeoliella sp. SH292 TaxID=3454464 RepID=UPI003F9BA588